MPLHILSCITKYISFLCASPEYSLLLGPRGVSHLFPFHSSLHWQSHSCTWSFALESRRYLIVEQKALEKRHLIVRKQLLIYIAKAGRRRTNKNHLQERFLHDRRASQVALGPQSKSTKHHYCHQVFRGREEHKMCICQMKLTKLIDFKESYISPEFSAVVSLCILTIKQNERKN